MVQDHLADQGRLARYRPSKLGRVGVVRGLLRVPRRMRGEISGTLARSQLEQHPEQRRLLAEQPELIPNAIEEVLRWSGVSQVSPKLVVRDTVLAGTELKDGDIVYALLIAANRDPSRWPDPQRFDVLREPKPHLAFGVGPHVCIGPSGL